MVYFSSSTLWGFGWAPRCCCLMPRFGMLQKQLFRQFKWIEKAAFLLLPSRTVHKALWYRETAQSRVRKWQPRLSDIRAQETPTCAEIYWCCTAGWSLWLPAVAGTKRVGTLRAQLLWEHHKGQHWAPAPHTAPPLPGRAGRNKGIWNRV